MQVVLDTTRHAVMITAFVSVMMLVVEYLNVLTTGAWQARLVSNRWGQYVLAAALGASPGCLGAFAVVALYSHGVLSLGAVVAAMLATAGDESFVMLALVPRQAVLLHLVLFALGVVVGVVVDVAANRFAIGRLTACSGLEIHLDEPCTCFAHGQIARQWQRCSPARGILGVGLAGFMVAVASGQMGPVAWNWVRITLLALAALALFIVVTAPDHFLEKHLWEHVARRHIPRVFAWTLGALLVVSVLHERVDIEPAVERNRWVLLLLACLLGLIPESGPHLILVTLYADGAIPMSILLANSIVQDGHGMLPMLAHSRRVFAIVKAINLAVGLLCGAEAWPWACSNFRSPGCPVPGTRVRPRVLRPRVGGNIEGLGELCATST